MDNVSLKNKPVVFIYAYHFSEEILKEVKAGIEEEGVMFEVRERRENKDCKKYALGAANASILQSGIGMNGKDLCFNNLLVKKNMSILVLENADRKSARTFGSNAARFIKGCSLKL